MRAVVELFFHPGDAHRRRGAADIAQRRASELPRRALRRGRAPPPASSHHHSASSSWSFGVEPGGWPSARSPPGAGPTGPAAGLVRSTKKVGPGIWHVPGPTRPTGVTVGHGGGLPGLAVVPAAAARRPPPARTGTRRGSAQVPQARARPAASFFLKRQSSTGGSAWPVERPSDDVCRSAAGYSASKRAQRVLIRPCPARAITVGTPRLAVLRHPAWQPHSTFVSPGTGRHGAPRAPVRRGPGPAAAETGTTLSARNGRRRKNHRPITEISAFA